MHDPQEAALHCFQVKQTAARSQTRHFWTFRERDSAFHLLTYVTYCILTLHTPVGGSSLTFSLPSPGKSGTLYHLLSILTLSSKGTLYHLLLHLQFQLGSHHLPFSPWKGWHLISLITHFQLEDHHLLYLHFAGKCGNLYHLLSYLYFFLCWKDYYWPLHLWLLCVSGLFLYCH